MNQNVDFPEKPKQLFKSGRNIKYFSSFDIGISMAIRITELQNTHIKIIHSKDKGTRVELEFIKNQIFWILNKGSAN